MVRLRLDRKQPGEKERMCMNLRYLEILEAIEETGTFTDVYKRQMCNWANGHVLILLVHCSVFHFYFNQLIKYINEGCMRCRQNFAR